MLLLGLHMGRSTLKVYLRKLEKVGLISIEERRDPVGDPTSNLYTLLDPSPAAVDAHLKARQAAAARKGGRSADDLPQVTSQPTGRSADDHKPESDLLTKEENQDVRHSAEGKEERTTPPARPDAQPCPHPVEERSRYGVITVCRHCWTMLEDQAETVLEGSEGDQAHAASAA